MRALEIVRQEDMVDWNRGSRTSYIELNPHDRDPPLFTIPCKKLASLAEGYDPRTVSDRFVVLRIAIEAIYDLFPASELGGRGSSDYGAIQLTDHKTSVRFKLILRISCTRTAPYLHRMQKGIGLPFVNCWRPEHPETGHFRTSTRNEQISPSSSFKTMSPV